MHTLSLAVTLILGRVLCGRILDRYHKEDIVLPCIAICVVSFIILAFSRTLPIFMLAAVVLGAGYTFFMPTLLVITIDRAGSSPGLAMGTFTAVADLALVLGPVTMGIVIHYAGYTMMFLSLGFIGLLNMAYFHFAVRKPR